MLALLKTDSRKFKANKGQAFICTKALKKASFPFLCSNTAYSICKIYHKKLRKTDLQLGKSFTKILMALKGRNLIDTFIQRP